MIAALDADALPLIHEHPLAGALHNYVARVARAMLAVTSAIERLVLLTRAENHARFDLLRDERCDVVLVPRPLFGGRPVSSWETMLTARPRIGADLLAAHQQEKLAVMRRTGAQVIHFPCDGQEGMEIDAPVVVSIHDGAGCSAAPLSALLADAVVLDSDDAARRLTRQGGVPWPKTFVAPWVCASTLEASEADNEDAAAPRDAFVWALCEAYDHALASFELRKAA